MTNEIEPRRPIPPAPIHPLSALATIVLDNIFGVFEFVDPLSLVITSITVGVLGTVTTMLVQHYVAKEEWGSSVAKGLVMGILAGVPFQVVGTVVGVPLLAWAGLHEWIKLPVAKNQQLPPSDEIVDADVKEVT
jgi:Na+-driven multidrug efflux pump